MVLKQSKDIAGMLELRWKAEEKLHMEDSSIFCYASAMEVNRNSDTVINHSILVPNSSAEPSSDKEDGRLCGHLQIGTIFLLGVDGYGKRRRWCLSAGVPDVRRA